MMKARRRSASRGFQSSQWLTQALEDRTLLTGNVLAAVVTGNLVLLGDGKANQIAIQTVSGNLQVASLDGTTTINGGAGPFTATGATGSVFIFLGNGDDVIDIGGGATTTAITDNLLIALGRGNDTVQMESTSVGGNAKIFGGSGNNTISVGSTDAQSVVTIGGDLFIGVGTGTNTVAVFNANIGGNLIMIGQGGNDHLQVGFDAGLGIIGVDETATGHVNVGGNLTIKDEASSFFNFGDDDSMMIWSEWNACGVGGLMGTFGECGLPWTFGNMLECDLGFLCFDGQGGCQHPGSPNGEHVALADVNVTGNVTIHTGGGSDEILIGAAHTPATDNNPLSNLIFGHVSVGGNLNVCSGNGNDTLVVVDVSVTANTVFTTGCGNDHIAVLDSNSTFGGNFTINAGGGNDDMVLQFDAVLGNFTLNGGRGNDVVWLAGDLFQQSVTINGGKGNNTFLESQSLFVNTFVAGAPTLNSFQTTNLNVLPTDPVVVTNFSWLSTLLGI